MKLLGLSVLLVMSFTASSFAQSEARSLEEKTIGLVVTDLQIEAKNINLLLSKIAYQYTVPISLEVATDDDLLKSKQLKVQVKKGTLADVLDSIVKQKPSYTWDVNENTIRVFPKGEFRDPLLQTLLETRISHFSVPKRTAKFTFRQALTNRPELKNLLASYGVRPSNEIFSHYDVESLGGDFLLQLENVPVRSILDHVIKNSQTKYWFIRRSGEYFLINL